jgi:uncharacterized protein
MLVKIEEIQEPGLELTEDVEAEVLQGALAESEGFVFKASTALVASFKRVSGRVHLQGRFQATVVAPCRRCLKEQRLEVPVEFSLRMVPHAELAASDEDDAKAPGSSKKGRHRRPRKEDELEAKEASFELDEVDAEPFDGKTIDLDPIIREQLLLALPLTVLCQEECRGLCSRCGQDLNERDCGHGGVKEVDVRLAKLKDIKLKN